MLFSVTTIVRLCGIAGILGALITGGGDLLYHYVPGSQQPPAERMAGLPQARLVAAGVLGLLGSWLYLLSVFHIYFAFLPVGSSFAISVSITFALVAVAYGVGHASYYAIGSGAKLARANGLDIVAAAQSGGALFSRIVMITYIPVAIASLLMLYGILSGRSSYPRWLVLFLPIVPYLLRTPILKIVGGSAREILRDSYDNFVFLVFFLVSTIVLWNLG